MRCKERVIAALNGNPYATLGLMARERVAYCERGVNSYQNEPELLVLITTTAGRWYGYLYRASPDQLEKSGAERPWVATLINARAGLEGTTAEEVLLSARYHLFWRNDYEPYFSQEPGDTHVFCATFEEGCRALEEIIRRFDPDLRDFIPDGDNDPIRPPGQCVIHCFADRWPSGEYFPPELVGPWVENVGEDG